MFSELPQIADIVSVGGNRFVSNRISMVSVIGADPSLPHGSYWGESLSRRPVFHGQHSSQGPNFCKIFYETSPLTDGPASMGRPGPLRPRWGVKIPAR
jgi:hypothetical protein